MLPALLLFASLATAQPLHKLCELAPSDTQEILFEDISQGIVVYKAEKPSQLAGKFEEAAQVTTIFGDVIHIAARLHEGDDAHVARLRRKLNKKLGPPVTWDAHTSFWPHPDGVAFLETNQPPYHSSLNISCSILLSKL